MNVLLHGLGSFLLVFLYRRDRSKTPQKVFIINLAVSELVFNICGVCRDATMLIYYYHGFTPIQQWTDDHQETSNRLVKLLFCINDFHGTGLTYMTTFSMFFLTCDRLMHVLLNMNYSLYWNVRRSWMLIVVTGLGSIILSTVFATLRHVLPRTSTHDINAIAVGHINNGLNMIYCLFAMGTYIIMFAKYVTSRRNTQNNNMTQTTTWTLFKNSKFFISVILITTYLIFTVVPYLTRATYKLLNPDLRPSSEKLSLFQQLNYYAIFSSRISQIVDAAIYIFLQKKVRKMLYNTNVCRYCLTIVRTLTRFIRGRRIVNEDGEENINCQNISRNRNTPRNYVNGITPSL